MPEKKSRALRYYENAASAIGMACLLCCCLVSLPDSLCGCGPKLRLCGAKVKQRKPLHPPTPLPLKRPRRLSFSDPAGGTEIFHRGFRRKQRIYSQEQSVFFRLPPEIRILVYQIMLCDKHIATLQYQHSRSRRTALMSYSFDEPVTMHSSVYSEGTLNKPFNNDAYPKHGVKGALTLLQSCRKVYTEALPFLYKGNTWHFSLCSEWYRTFTLDCFIPTVLPERLRLISSLHLEVDIDTLYCSSDWNKTCEFLITRFELQNLNVKLQTQSSYYTTYADVVSLVGKPFVEPLARVLELSSLNHVQVCMPRTSEELVPLMRAALIELGAENLPLEILLMDVEH